ncbi:MULTISPECIES: hypothetical protein [Salinibaculum]|uniref:hypothetical protein n=1 Tax=Salinibaculum TaxID=2732368 RepID=UPI0030D59B71
MSTDDSTTTEEMSEPTSWPELGIALYERLTGRNATIEYTFDDMKVAVPSKVGEDAEHAHWEIDGTVSITTHED